MLRLIFLIHYGLVTCINYQKYCPIIRTPRPFFIPTISPCHPRDADPLINEQIPPITKKTPSTQHTRFAKPPTKPIASISNVRTACTGNSAILRITLKAVPIPYNTVIIGSPFLSPSEPYKQSNEVHIPALPYGQAPTPA